MWVSNVLIEKSRPRAGLFVLFRAFRLVKELFYRGGTVVYELFDVTNGTLASVECADQRHRTHGRNR